MKEILKIEEISTGTVVDYFKWNRYRAFDIHRRGSTVFTLPNEQCHQLYNEGTFDKNGYRYTLITKEQYEREASI